MAKNSQFSASMRKFRDKLRYFVMSQTEELTKEASEEVAKTIVRIAQNNLVNRATPSPESKELITGLKNNISSYKNTISIQSDPEGLMMFLEYGTGINNKPHPEANKIGWEYGVNSDKYIIFKKTDQSGNNKIRNMGWVFERKNNHYIDRNDWKISDDSKFKTSYNERVRFYFRKDGTYVKSYTRKRPHGPKVKSEKELVFSSGIKPVRYIYDAKKAVRDFVDLNKGISMTEFIEELKELK